MTEKNLPLGVLNISAVGRPADPTLATVTIDLAHAQVVLGAVPLPVADVLYENLARVGSISVKEVDDD